MCKLARFLYAVVPAARFRARLIRKHFAACPRCSKTWGAEPPWAGLLRPPDWIPREASLWPAVERLLTERVAAAAAPPRPPLQRRLAEAAAAAGGVAAVAILALLLGGHRPTTAVGSSAVSGPPRVEVLSAEVEGLPARASIYQTKRASFIWFSRTPRKEG